MLNLAQQIAHYLARYRAGDGDNAFHSLRELGPDALPLLIERFRQQAEADVRVFLVSVITSIRHDSAVPFLADALFEADPEIWKQAMDGLVVLASPTAIEALKAGRRRKFSAVRDQVEFGEWLEEAIEQAEKGFPDVQQ